MTELDTEEVKMNSRMLIHCMFSLSGATNASLAVAYLVVQSENEIIASLISGNHSL